MGIRFSNHPDLRRILMWDGYPFFPLRKDFPLEGLPSEMPDVAFTSAAPMEGGPFVTQPSTATAKDREPRARRPEFLRRRIAAFENLADSISGEVRGYSHDLIAGLPTQSRPTKFTRPNRRRGRGLARRCHDIGTHGIISRR